MNNAQIVKKRLKDLKLLSQNLKQSSEQKLQLDLNVIKVIMNITKNVQQNQQEKFNSIKFQRENNSNRSTQQNKLFSNRATSQSQSTHKPHMKTIRKIQSRSYEEDDDEEKIYNQLKLTRQKNLKLQQKVKQLEQKISVEQKRSQKQFKHLPYFKLTQNLSIFLTKLKVNQKQYDKIQYQAATLVLTLDHIKILNEESNQLSQIKQRQSDAQNFQVDIGDIINVKYLKNYIVLLVLQSQKQEQCQYLFIKFDNYQNMHRWDTGIYINYQIIKSLGSNQLFSIHKVFQRPTLDQQEKTNNQLIQKENKLKIMQQQQQIIRKSFKIGQQQNLNQSQKIKLLNFMDLESKYLNAQNDVKQFIERKSEALPEQLTIQTKQISNNELNNDKLSQNKQQKQIIFEAPKNHQQIEKAIEENKIKLDSIQQLKIMKQQQMERQKKKLKQKQAKQQLQLQEAKLILKRGMYVTKYAEGAFNPHEKKVFLSSGQDKLCWQDKDKKQYKFVLIEEITSVNYGEIGPGIVKHIGKKNINNIHCFVVIKLKTEGRSQLEFGMRSANLMQNFADKLTLFLLSHNKKNVKSQQLKIF